MTVDSTTKLIDKPICDKHSDCFANHGGRCVCLINNDFGSKECPFYKGRKRYEEEKRI